VSVSTDGVGFKNIAQEISFCPLSRQSPPTRDSDGAENKNPRTNGGFCVGRLPLSQSQTADFEKLSGNYFKIFYIKIA